MLSQLDPTEVVELASNEETSGFFDLPISPVDANKLLRPWSEVARASPHPLSDRQYAAFIRGQAVPEETETDETMESVSVAKHLRSTLTLEFVSTAILALIFGALGLLHFLQPARWLEQTLLLVGAFVLATLVVLIISQLRRLTRWQRRIG
jgi:hypothetical protein